MSSYVRDPDGEHPGHYAVRILEWTIGFFIVVCGIALIVEAFNGMT